MSKRKDTVNYEGVYKTLRELGLSEDEALEGVKRFVKWLYQLDEVEEDYVIRYLSRLSNRVVFKECPYFDDYKCKISGFCKIPCPHYVYRCKRVEHDFKKGNGKIVRLSLKDAVELAKKHPYLNDDELKIVFSLFTGKWVVK